MGVGVGVGVLQATKERETFSNSPIGIGDPQKYKIVVYIYHRMTAHFHL